MASKNRKARKTPKKKGLDFSLNEDVQRDILAVLLLAAAAVTLLAMLFPAGEIGRWWSDMVSQAFGWGWPLALVAMVGLAIALLRQNLDFNFQLKGQQVLGGGLLLLALLGLLHLIGSFGTEAQQLVETGRGGGYLGNLLSSLLAGSIGWVGAFFVLLAIVLVGIILTFDITMQEMQAALAAAWAGLTTLYRQRLWPLFHQPTVRVSPPPRPVAPPTMPPTRPSPAVPGAATPTAAPTRVAAPLGGVLPPREWKLPPLDLLEITSEQELSQADIRRRVRIIEETLQNFNIQARVVEVNQGPAVTQFGVQPAPGVSVSRIVARQNDLALALAAAPIRIEAPVPGKSVVGIEVPNSVTALVGLRGLVESTAFQRIVAKSKLAMALGQDVAGAPIVADLDKMPHLLIAGATGSGKSVCLNSIIACLLLHTKPDELNFVMIDPKRVELTIFDGIPHLRASPVVVEVDKAVSVLQGIVREMDRRYLAFANTGVRNIDGYNRLPARSGREKMPYIILVIDELADLMMIAADQVERMVCRLAQMARATGIHVVIATQRPSVDVVTGLIKANFPARISFAVTSQIDSRVILDMGGAEKLLGRGDMLYMASDSSKVVRLQGSFVSDEELKRIVDFWKAQSAGVAMPLPGAGTLAPWMEEQPEEEDPLLQQAITVVRSSGRASVSLLQRKLRIGYARAARLMDIMEEQGIVKPSEDGRSREVLDESEDPAEADKDGGEEGR